MPRQQELEQKEEQEHDKAVGVGVEAGAFRSSNSRRNRIQGSIKSIHRIG